MAARFAGPSYCGVDRRAGIPAAAKIRPHSLRHSFATELLAAGVPLQDVQDAHGPRRPSHNAGLRPVSAHLDRHLTYAMAAQLRHSGPGDVDGSEKG